MKNFIPKIILCSLMLISSAVSADQVRVTTLQAAPGQLEALISDVKDYRTAKSEQVIIMRHSQGDHWDLLLLEPAGLVPTKMADFGHRANFQHTFLATTDAKFTALKATADKTGLYHIEMFHALAGKKQELVGQRRMENRYLKNTGQVTNEIFGTVIGSDVDIFTIGFHTDMTAFAKGPSVSDAQAESFAKEAGFRDRNHIGLYLRSLLTRHFDTLAVPVK